MFGYTIVKKSESKKIRWYNLIKLVAECDTSVELEEITFIEEHGYAPRYTSKFFMGLSFSDNVNLVNRKDNVVKFPKRKIK